MNNNNNRRPGFFGGFGLYLLLFVIAIALFSAYQGNNFGGTGEIKELEFSDFVTQLQADPKFEKLIDTMTMGRMLGGSKLAKNGIRF